MKMKKPAWRTWSKLLKQAKEEEARKRVIEEEEHLKAEKVKEEKYTENEVKDSQSAWQTSEGKWNHSTKWHLMRMIDYN